MTKQVLKNYEKAAQELADCFVKKYFDKDASCEWVGDRIGDVYMVNDYWFDVDRMREALEFGATKEQLFEYYDLELETHQKGEKLALNFTNYLRRYDFCLKQ